MKKIARQLSNFLCLTAALFGSPALAQTPEITATSQQFAVTKFFYIDSSNGDWIRQRVVGFAEPQITGVKRRVIFLPSIDVKPDGVSFIANNGMEIQDLDKATEATVAKVRVSLVYDGQLADSRQRLAALSQLYPSVDSVAVPEQRRYEPSAPNGTFLDMLGYQHAAITARNAEMMNVKARQDAQVLKWEQLLTNVAAINNVRFTLLIDGEVVASRIMSGTLVSSGALPDLLFPDVTEYQINRIKEGGFQIGIEYGFIDSNTKSIEAKFDMDRVMSQVVNESRQITSASKKSGVQILGFGKRKSIMSQAIKEESRESVTQDNKANTVIQMRDADDSMIAMFESKFFPQLAKAQVVENHLKAGEAAKSNGDEMLAKAHFGYAKAVQDEKLDLDVDTAGAMASLAAGDYAGFVAKGVKMQKSEGSASSQFARVLTKDVKESIGVDWALVKTVSIQRVVSMVIETQNEARRANLGLCDVVQHQIPNPSNTKMVPVIIPTCLIVGGPLDKAGFKPGEVIGRLDDKIVRTYAELENILSTFKPGGVMSVERLIPTPMGWQQQVVNVKLAKGAPI